MARTLRQQNGESDEHYEFDDDIKTIEKFEEEIFNKEFTTFHYSLFRWCAD